MTTPVSGLKYLIGIFLLSVSSSLVAQNPSIVNFAPKSAPAGSELVILGNGFSNNANELVVHFGSVNAAIIDSKENILVVEVPHGATCHSISVTNLNSGLTGNSSVPFLPSYSGDIFDVNGVSAPVNFASENELYDLSLNDFDIDGKVDVITANNNSNLITVYHNTSSAGVIGFTKKLITLNSSSLSVTSGDLNGDGKPDAVVSKSGNPGDRIFLLRNTSVPGNITFATPQFLLVEGNVAAKIVIKDLDNDGLPELIITNQQSSSISIFKNISTPGTITFEPLQTVILNDPNSTNLNSSGLSVEDLNGDGFPEIVASQFLEKNIFIIPNLSQVGLLQFGTVQIINVPGNIVSLAIGDINLDEKPDIIATKLQQNTVSILLNTGTDREINFSGENLFIVNDRPWGLDLGDINGDGKIDICIASINFTARKISILENHSSGGVLNLITKFVNTPEITRNLKLGDIDNDGKPDFVLTSIETFNITVLRNKNCFLPSIIPSGPISICTGMTDTLKTGKGIGISYDWYKDNVIVKTGVENFFELSLPGTYKVIATSESGSCSKESNEVVVIHGTGNAPTLPGINNAGPFCQAENIVLTTNIVNNAIYKWTGPDNFTSASQNISIPDASADNAGTYFLQVSVGECSSDIASSIVQVNTLPDFTISNTGNNEICLGDSVTVRVSELSGYSYQWYKNSQLVGGATNYFFVIRQAGSYNVEVTNDATTCSSFSPNSININVLTAPVADFTDIPTGCINSGIQFTNLSTFQNGASVIYTWNFGDGSAHVNDANPLYTYLTNGSYNIGLTISYSSGACSDSTKKPITINNLPDIQILMSDTNMVCTGDTIILATSADFQSYLWTTSETTRSIQITNPGIFGVEVTDQNNCVNSVNETIEMFEKPNVTATPSPIESGSGTPVQLQADGALSYSWTPGNFLNDSTISNPVSIPLESIIYVVTGSDANGCTDTAAVSISIPESNSININPEKLFSPNGDGIEDFWKIDNLELYPGNTIMIFNGNGNTVYEASPYQNNWNAVYNGKNLTEGVYFYVIRVDGKEPKTGSITVIR